MREIITTQLSETAEDRGFVLGTEYVPLLESRRRRKRRTTRDDWPAGVAEGDRELQLHLREVRTAKDAAEWAEQLLAGKPDGMIFTDGGVFATRW